MQLDVIYNCDCLDGFKKLDDNSIDLIVTSPPYNVGIDYDSWEDNMKWNDYLKWCNKWLTECYRVLKDDGRICVNHYIAFSPHDYDSYGNFENNECRFPLFDFREMMTTIGFNVNKLCIWNDLTLKKPTAWGSWLSASAPNIMTPYEGILIAYKNQWKKMKSGISTISKDEFLEGVSGIWNIGTTIGLTKANFPEKLPRMCINLLSYYDDVVLDCFMGSGTTAKVSKELGRHYIGFEISKNYYDISCERVCNTIKDSMINIENIENKKKESTEDKEIISSCEYSKQTLIDI